MKKSKKLSVWACIVVGVGAAVFCIVFFCALFLGIGDPSNDDWATTWADIKYGRFDVSDKEEYPLQIDKMNVKEALGDVRPKVEKWREGMTLAWTEVLLRGEEQMDSGNGIMNFIFVGAVEEKYDILAEAEITIDMQRQVQTKFYAEYGTGKGMGSPAIPKIDLDPAKLTVDYPQVWKIAREEIGEKIYEESGSANFIWRGDYWQVTFWQPKEGQEKIDGVELEISVSTGKVLSMKAVEG